MQITSTSVAFVGVPGSIRIVLSLAFIYAAVGAWVWLASYRMIFLPPPPSYRDTPDIIRLSTVFW